MILSGSYSVNLMIIFVNCDSTYTFVKFHRLNDV